MKVFMKKKINKYRQNGYFFKIAWLVLLCLISALLARYALAGINDMLAVGKVSSSATIEIPEGSGLEDIARILKQNNIINEKEFFKIYAKVTKSSDKFLPGIYELQTNMDYQAIINYLKNRSNVKNIAEVTLKEGMNLLEYAEVLQKSEVCKKEEFLKCCNSDQFEKDYTFLKVAPASNDRVYKLEGYLFPDTYSFYKDENPSDIIKKMLNNYQKKIIKKDTLEGYDKKVSIKELAEEKGLTAEKLTIIASLIQAEAANKEDMYKVSSVIHNRLATVSKGGQSHHGEFSMNILRIDSTTYYPYKTKAAIPTQIAKSFKSNYDTYKIEGLPPGAICNPGMDAFLAALNPASTDYYYYCHSNRGSAFYAKTNAEHLLNLKKAGLA